MYKKLLITMLIGVLTLSSLSACSSKRSDQKPASTEQSSENNQKSTIASTEKPKSTPPTDSSAKAEDSLLSCGEVFTDKNLSVNILGVKEEKSESGERFLLIKMEVFNSGSSDMNFSSLMSFDLTDESRKTSYSLSPFAKTEGSLDGTIFPNNKIIGEVAFEIEDSKDNIFVLHIAQDFEYKPAYKITDNNFGNNFEEVFENQDIKSDYTVGVPVETDSLTILLKSVSKEESKKEGLDLLLCEMELTNKTSDSQPFFLGFHYDVFSADGMNLDMFAGRFDFPVEVEGNSSVSGIASFYFEKGKTDFYMTVKSNLGNQSKNETIVFSLEEQKDNTAMRKLPKYEEFEEKDLVPNYPLDVLPLYQNSKVIDSMYDYAGGTGQSSKHIITADSVLPSGSFDDAVKYYSEFGLNKEISTTNNDETEEVKFTGELGEYTVEISVLRFLKANGDPLVSIRISY